MPTYLKMCEPNFRFGFYSVARYNIHRLIGMKTVDLRKVVWC